MTQLGDKPKYLIVSASMAILLCCFACSTLTLKVNGALRSTHSKVKPVTLVRKYRSGDTKSYRFVAKMVVFKDKIKITQQMKITVVEVIPEQIAEMKIEFKNIETLINGQVKKHQTTTFLAGLESRDKHGKLLTYIPSSDKDTQSPEIQQLIASTREIIFQDKPAIPGFFWKTELENPIFKAQHFIIKTKYLGTENVEKLKCWKLRQFAEIEVKKGDVKLTIVSTSWHDPIDGSTVKVNTTMDGFPTTTTVPQKYEMSITREKVKTTILKK